MRTATLDGMYRCPTEITFRDMPTSPALEASIHDWVDKLVHVCPIQRCTVVVETPHKHQHRGRHFRTHLTIGLPGRSITVSRPAHENAYLAIADAFRSARRQLVDFLATRRDARPVA